MLRTSLVATAAAAALLLGAACGSDTPDAPENASSVATDVSSGVPELNADANDTTKEAVISAGEGDAPTEVVTADIVTGTGETATAESTVDVRYTGALYDDGTVFDSSWARGQEPTTFPLSGVVPGFAEGIVGMQIGGRREIVIPPAEGYGDVANGPIPAGSTLVFVVDLVALS